MISLQAKSHILEKEAWPSVVVPVHLGLLCGLLLSPKTLGGCHHTFPACVQALGVGLRVIGILYSSWCFVSGMILDFGPVFACWS